jgi:purine-nucleoside phosphorylase
MQVLGMDSDPFQLAATAASQLTEIYDGRTPSTFLVLGSGWDAAIEQLGTTVEEFGADRLVGAALTTVPSHNSSIRLIELEDGHILVARGRVHLYEGHDPCQVVHLLRAAIGSGAGNVILTNAAGSIDADKGPGTPVLIADHLNLTGLSPMWGQIPPDGPLARFVDMTEAYSRRLRDIARQADATLTEGVYAGFHGPEFETPAEITMAKTMGATLVGMSTVLETIAARHMGAEVLGLSLVTNFAAGMSGPLAHSDVVETATSAGRVVGPLLADIARRVNRAAPTE